MDGGLIVSGYISGCVVASFGSLLKAFAPKRDRLKTCADILIYSNVIMIAINVVAVNISPYAGLYLSLACVMLGMLFIWTLPAHTMNEEGEKTERKQNQQSNINKPLLLLARNASDYLTVDTLMLGVCGIFALFWWSILGEMLDYTDTPVRVFGLGLAANVLGVLAGGVLGRQIVSLQFSTAEVTVIALTSLLWQAAEAR